MPEAARRPSLIIFLTSLVVGLVGLVMGGGGALLVLLGGSPYYLATGLAMLATAGLLWRGRAVALWLYALILVGTLAWAVWEVGFDFWALVPRGDIITPLGIWLLLPFVSGRLGPAGRGARAALGGAVVLAVVTMGIALTRHPDAINGVAQNRRMPPGNVAAADWPAYGGTNWGDRFSALTQITPANVHRLKLVWQFRTGDVRGPNDPNETTDEDTPLKIHDTLYACSPHQTLFAIDAATGKLRWKFDPKIKDNPTFQHLTCRGVSFHETMPGATTIDGKPAPADCPRRIFLPTNTGFLYAVNADDGTLCRSFGDDGRVDLKTGSPYQVAGFYEGTSPPAVGSQVVVVGGAVIDNWSNKVPSGAIRAYDVYSGKLLWVFDAGNHDPNEMPSPMHQLTAGSPNSWAPAALDDKLGMVYLPLGEGADDIWGGHRSADEERYDSALVALDLKTGKLIWSYQNVHHDLWDFDVPAQPSLADIETPQGVVPVLYMPTKSGSIFVLDRRNGRLIVPAPERPVPQDAAAGDHTAPTQPFSDLSFRPKPLSGSSMWGTTLVDQLACRIKFHRLKYQGPFTPPSIQGTLVFPGNLGVFEWGGIALDQARQIGIANPIGLAFIVRLIPRTPQNPPTPPLNLPAGSEAGVQPMFGTPFGVKISPFLSPLGIPCLQPPWGKLAAFDLRTGKVIWEHPVGTSKGQKHMPIGLPLGMPMLGAPLATAGGVIFLTSTMDDYIRAYDMMTGKLLWSDPLPAGGQSTPMSYSMDGKQYIVTVDGGHGSFGTKLGDYIRAYALPGGG
jgi:quinoprotein glucose dehydrogenase